MFGRQEAPRHIRYVEAVCDAYSVLSASVVLDVELKSAFARDFKPITYPIYLSFVFAETQVLKQVGLVGHASQCVAINPDRIGVRVESDRWGHGLKRRLTLEGQMGVVPGGRTGESWRKISTRQSTL